MFITPVRRDGDSRGKEKARATQHGQTNVLGLLLGNEAFHRGRVNLLSGKHFGLDFQLQGGVTLQPLMVVMGSTR